MTEDELTLIQVKKVTAQRLKSKRIAEYETYDEIIWRALDHWDRKDEPYRPDDVDVQD